MHTLTGKCMQCTWKQNLALGPSHNHCLTELGGFMQKKYYMAPPCANVSCFVATSHRCWGCFLLVLTSIRWSSSSLPLSQLYFGQPCARAGAHPCLRPWFPDNFFHFLYRTAVGNYRSHNPTVLLLFTSSSYSSSNWFHPCSFNCQISTA